MFPLLSYSTIVLSVFINIDVFASGPCALLEPRADALCIPLASINRAFRDARIYFGIEYPSLFPPHKTLHHLHEIDLLGMVLSQTTKYLAKEFQLTQHQIETLLPQLDLELTDIWGFCPQQFRPRECKLHRYREITGECNNLNHPEWGAAHSSFRYLLPSVRPDGVDHPKDPDGTYLPPVRLVSNKIHRDHVFHDHSITVMLIAWGQIIDHDITLTAETKDHHTHKDPDCCQYLYDPDAKLHHNCFPIQIPENDEFYSGHNHRCMNFLRSYAAVRPNCRLGTRTAMNSISSFLDANFVYGSNEHLSFELRTGKYGMLKSLPIFHKQGLKNLLPLKLEYPDEGCIRPSENIFCFLAGDHRVNEQLVLTVLHTLFMRQHNFISKELSKINAHWNDERLYQEARRIIIAITQHITYSEFLPMILGKELMKEYKISTYDGFWNGYDPNFDPSATEEFITSAFRFGHSLLPHHIERWSSSHHFIESTELSRLIRQPFDIYQPGHADTYILGMVNQLAQVMDEGVTEQVTSLLFRKPYKNFGMDLVSMNLQRGRDHGLNGYVAYRKLCGFTPVTNWWDLNGIMRNETIEKYKSIYRSPHDIDLWSGGVSEIPHYGSLLGPTFSCIIALQFQALRHGDRYWYELPDLPSSFSEEQLVEIKKIKLSRLLCDNADSIKTIQVYAMVYPDPQRNPRVPCQGSVLPRIDLSKWQEDPPYHHHHHETYKHGTGNVEQDNYLTLHPPKYDPSFSKIQDNGNHYGYQPQSNIYNISYETTQFLPEPPSYQEVPNIVEYRSPNEYEVQPKEPHSGKNYKHEQHHESYENESNNNGGPELLESLEAPQAGEGDNGEELIFISKENYGPPDGPPPPDPPKQFRQPQPMFFRKPILPRKLHINPFPPSPFPGLGGIFSPNPGYLVKQRFSLPRGIRLPKG